MNNKFIATLFSLIICTAIAAQKKLSYNTKGELSTQDQQALLSTRKYQALSAFDTVSTKPLLVYAIYIKNKKLGILDHMGKEVTPAIYDAIEGMNITYTTVMFGFHDNYPVRIGKKYGLISNKGKAILPVEYDHISSEEKRSVNRTYKKEAVTDSVIIARKGNDEIHFSPQGKLLTKRTEDLSNITEKVGQYKEYDYSAASSYETKKYETTPHGNIIKKMDNGLAIVEAKVDNKYYYQGLVELATNKLLLPVQYTYLIPSLNNGIIAIKGKKYNLYDSKGQLALKDTFDGIDNFNKSYKIKKEGKTAIFDTGLNQKTGFIYDDFGSSGPDFAIARIGTKEGVIDTYGNEVVPFIYDRVEGYFSRQDWGFAFFKVTKNKKQGIISTKGQPLTEVIYDQIVPECTIEDPANHFGDMMPTDHDYDERNNSFFIVNKDGKFGLLDNDLKPLVPIQYELLKKSFHKDLVIVGKKGSSPNNYALTLLKIRANTPILPYEYDDFKYLGGRYFMIYQKGMMGVCDFDGKVIIPMATYRDMADRYYYNEIYHGLYQVNGRQSNYMIDHQGKQVNMSKN